MDTYAPSLHEFRALLNTAMVSFSSPRRRAFLEPKLIEPYKQLLRWEYGQDEECTAWVFADLGERDVIAQYCRGGFGSLGSPWGINFRDANQFGQDSGWYCTLEELVTDWGAAE